MSSVVRLLVFASIALATASAVGAELRVPADYTTIAGAIAAASPGDRILVGPGDFDGAYVDKSVEIRGIGGARIVGGPAHPSGLIQGFRLLAGSDGATISHLTFTTDLSIMNGAQVDSVTVAQCTFINSVQAVSNWGGSDWEISHNNIVGLRTRCGGGIGILVADFTGGLVENNVVSHNTITGVLDVSDGDCGGYNGSGIVIYADFRWGRAGAAQIAYNRVVKNKVSMTSDNPGLVDIVAIELTDTDVDAGKDPSLIVVMSNAIGFNDLRGTALQIALSDGAEDVNDISRNLGENRGHGLHPAVFGPGG